MDRPVADQSLRSQDTFGRFEQEPNVGDVQLFTRHLGFRRMAGGALTRCGPFVAHPIHATVR
jgi:hypothetical protein